MRPIGIEHRIDGTISSNIDMDGVVSHQGYIHTISDSEGFKRVFRRLVLDGIGLGIRPGKGFQDTISTSSITC